VPKVNLLIPYSKLKENFVSGVLPSRIQAVGGAKFGLRKVKTIFWGFGFHFSETDF
jgi:hypothetical protein